MFPPPVSARDPAQNRLAQAKENLRQFMLRVREHLLIAAIALVVSALVVAAPAHATSFSIDMEAMMSSAADIFNGLWPAFAIVIGLGLGVQILRFIVNAVRAAF